MRTSDRANLGWGSPRPARLARCAVGAGPVPQVMCCNRPWSVLYARCAAWPQGRLLIRREQEAASRGLAIGEVLHATLGSSIDGDSSAAVTGGVTWRCAATEAGWLCDAR